MERYIFTRGYGKPEIASPGYTLERIGSRFLLFDENHDPEFAIDSLRSCEEVPDDIRVCLLKIDEDLLKSTFNSFAYTNWLKEKQADIDDEGQPLYTGLTKSPETLIMYLMELGISSDTLMRYIYGPGNKYLEYKYLVQQFGKML